MEKELYLYPETADGFSVRIPSSRMAEFAEKEEAKKNGTYKAPELTEEQEKRFEAMVMEAFQPPHLASKTAQEK